MVDEVIIKGNSGGKKTIAVGKLGEIIRLFSKTIYRGSFASEYHPQSFFSLFSKAHGKKLNKIFILYHLPKINILSKHLFVK